MRNLVRLLLYSKFSENTVDGSNVSLEPLDAGAVDVPADGVDIWSSLHSMRL